MAEEKIRENDKKQTNTNSLRPGVIIYKEGVLYKSVSEMERKKIKELEETENIINLRTNYDLEISNG